jgi:hypothetical protein
MGKNGNLFTQGDRCECCGQRLPKRKKKKVRVNVEVARELVRAHLPLKYNLTVASQVSAVRNAPRRINQREIALAYWIKTRMATWDDVSVATGIPPKNSSRMTELEELGLLRRTGVLRKTQFGGMAEVMECLVSP